MSSILHLTVVTPEKVLFEGDVNYIYAPGGAGFFGVCPDHAPMLASLQPGIFEIRPVAGDPIKFKTKCFGFFEVVKNNASILLDAADTKSWLNALPLKPLP
jgi:F-type H+-transporting ATPase subunit epsilon